MGTTECRSTHMEDFKPDVWLHVEDIRQILELFGFEASQDNINSIMRVKTTFFAIGIRAALEGKIAPDMETGLRLTIERCLIE